MNSWTCEYAEFRFRNKLSSSGLLLSDTSGARLKTAQKHPVRLPAAGERHDAVVPSLLLLHCPDHLLLDMICAR